MKSTETASGFTGLTSFGTIKADGFTGSVHVAGCGAIEKDAKAHSSMSRDNYATLEDALRGVDPDGIGAPHVHSCVKRGGK